MPYLNKSAAPLSLTISDIRIRNHLNTYEMSVFPQLREVNIYSSIFSTLQRMEITLYDGIGLLSNFPLVGEEIVSIDITTTGTKDTQTIRMIATKPVNIIPDSKGRATTFTLQCYSREILLNNTVRLQNCYSQPISTTVEQILKEKLKTTKNVAIEQTKGNVHFVVPNMYPLEAVRLLTQLAVAQQYDHYSYVFFENSTGFHFETVEKLISEQPKAEYKYYSQYVKQNEEDDHYRIIQLTQNKRYDTLEKQTMGFYSNELYEIDYFNKKTISTKTYADSDKPDPVSLGPGQVNTKQFINNQLALPKSVGKGIASRVRYRTLNGARDVEQLNLADKFGLGVVHRTAMSQMSISISVPGDTKINAGDVVTVKIPEFHGFNEVDFDPYIEGKYLVTDICHRIVPGEKHIMILNVNRDSYNRPIGPTRYKS